MQTNPVCVKYKYLSNTNHNVPYYKVHMQQNKNIENNKKNCIPLLGVGPRDPTVWPLGGLGVDEKGPRYP